MSDVSGFQPGKRRLCPDGACIGVLGADGRCRVCGISADDSGTAAATSSDDLEGDDSVDEFGDASAAGAGELDTPGHAGGHAGLAANGEDTDISSRFAPAGPGEGFRPDRRLCDDGSCIGVVGASGACSVCGRRAEH